MLYLHKTVLKANWMQPDNENPETFLVALTKAQIELLKAMDPTFQPDANKNFKIKAATKKKSKWDELAEKNFYKRRPFS